MALKALDIFKLLPKTNCKDCGCPTCLAFAMKLAQKQTTLDQCPHVTDEAKAALEGASAPPVRLVKIGTGAAALEIGNETVLFRHEETFYHPPGIGIVIPDTLSEDALAAQVEKLAASKFVRVGTNIEINVAAVDDVAGDADAFARTAAAVAAAGVPLVLISGDAGRLAKALEVTGDGRPLICGATPDNWEAVAALAKSQSCPLAVSAPDLDALAELTPKIVAAGVEDLVLDLGGEDLAATLQTLTAARRLALKKQIRALGYPFLTICRTEDPMANMSACCSYVAKFSGVVLTTLTEPEALMPVLTVRQNIYTDPRKPIQVEPGLYEVGAVTPDSALLLTTNFSLTYYTVEGEVEASRVPAYIGVVDTEGTSVLTAFASDKLNADNVTAFLNSDEVKAKVGHKKLILPGYISVMSGGLHEESGWEIMVGPREASGISKYLKTVWQGA
ncbi:MAG: acetyl-CoA decarbonylase/synthase complex subunit gamma [Kiritimatiellae bacterium]|nr:acetyl-CoA decarbonylase/synthase complex subunit gamma [Kiritimatiellia bacterium]